MLASAPTTKLRVLGADLCHAALDSGLIWTRTVKLLHVLFCVYMLLRTFMLMSESLLSLESIATVKLLSFCNARITIQLLFFLFQTTYFTMAVHPQVSASCSAWGAK